MNGVPLVASLVLLAVQSRKVNDPLSPDQSTGGSDVASLLVSPDGAWVAYLADPDVDELFELYTAPLHVSAAARKLSAGGWRVSGDYRISAGVQRAVFRARAGLTGQDELASVPIDGSAPIVELNDALPAFVSVLSFVLSPDGSRAVYLVDQDADSRLELWSVPTDRSAAPVRVNGNTYVRQEIPGASGFGEATYRISPDGTRVAFLADLPTNGKLQLYSAAIAGGSPPVRLNGTLPTGGNVGAFRFAPNSQRVVYRADQGANDVDELYSVPAAGGTAAKLNGPLVTGGDVSRFDIDPLSARVAYLADELTDEKVELFTRPLDGSGTALKVSTALIADGDVWPWGLSIAPGGQRIAYLADAEVVGRWELYSVGLDGSSPLKLNAALPAGGSVGFPFPQSSILLYSGDGARVVYWADQDTDDVVELYSVPISGGVPAKLSGPLVSGGNVSPDGLRVTADGTRVLFLADKTVDERFELWIAPIDASAAPTRLSGTLPSTGDVRAPDVGVDPSNQRVAYRADALVDGQDGLWSARLDGAGAPRELSGPLHVPPPAGGDVLAYTWSPDGERALYVADQLEDNIPELFSKHPGSFAAAQRVSLPPVDGQMVEASAPLLFDPDNGHVIFHVFGGAGQGDIRIYSAGLDGRTPPALLGEVLSYGRLISEFPLNGGRLVYADEQQVPTHAFPIWNASTDGSRSPFQLTDPSSSATLIDVEVSPQEDIVVFADLQAGLYGLHAVPVDGGTLPLALTAPLGSFYELAFTPAGDRVVFTGQFGTANPPELWTVPTAGGASVRLTPPLAGDRAAFPFLLTPDGTRVVYRADQDLDEVFELYSVPVAGGASVKLSGTMTSGGDVDADFSSYPYRLQAVISPDSTRVIYRADQVSDGAFELFSAPVDGSSPAVRLNAPLSGLKAVVRSQFLFTPDSQHVVYVADEDTYLRPELHLVPVDGSQPGIELTPPMAGGVHGLSDSSGPPFALTPDGVSVVYMADQTANGTYELFSVGLDGSRISKRLNGPLVAGGDVMSFQLGPTGDVLYLADEEQGEVFELFYTLGPHRVPPVRRR